MKSSFGTYMVGVDPDARYAVTIDLVRVMKLRDQYKREVISARLEVKSIKEHGADGRFKFEYEGFLEEIKELGGKIKYLDRVLDQILGK